MAAMKNCLHDYQVRFLGADGTLIEDVILSAKSLAIAIDCAGLVGTEIGAANFYVASKPDGRKSRMNAAA
jgi:hypothetical protein